MSELDAYVCSAKNSGIEAAKGDYIFFTNGDDHIIVTKR